jgi:probable rRNA maturation factor
MRELNRRYRRKDRTTDVLSFGQSLRRGAKGTIAASTLKREADGTLELGDVVISGAQAARQAKRRRWPLATEVAFLAAHGALHLLGFEDDTTSGYREMLRLGNDALPRIPKRRGVSGGPRRSLERASAPSRPEQRTRRDSGPA